MRGFDFPMENAVWMMGGEKAMRLKDALTRYREATTRDTTARDADA